MKKYKIIQLAGQSFFSFMAVMAAHLRIPLQLKMQNRRI